MKHTLLTIIIFTLTSPTMSQEKLTYQKPPTEILELFDISLPPYVAIDDEGENAVLLYRDIYKSIAELSEKELRLGGLRVNPKTNISSRTTYYNNIKIKIIASLEKKQVKGLPKNPRLSNFKWSPDKTKMAFTNTTNNGVELWLLNVENFEAKKLSDAILNANKGNPITWFRDGSALLVRFLPENKKPLINTDEVVPTGPTITISDGSKAANRTYQDLLKNKNDEFNFEQLILSDIYKVELNGEKQKWAKTAMYKNISFSPDGQYVLITTIHRPFSYIVPYYRFPQKTTIYKSNGDVFKVFNEAPLLEVLPQGFMAVRTGKRSIKWRADKPNTLYWIEALDEGDHELEVEYRDEVFQLQTPFTDKAESILKTINRFDRIWWATDDYAIAEDYWWNTRNTKTYLFNPSNPSQEVKILYDRNYQDIYSDPGMPVLKKNKYKLNIIALKNDEAYLLGDGYTKEGQFPFIDKINFKTFKTTRVYQSEYTDKIESIYDAIDIEKETFLVKIESPTEYPNYFIRDINNNKLKQITHFKNPFKSIQNVHKEVIKYKRDDSVELSGTLYLPVGYDMEKKEKVPLIIWAYPREYKDKQSAGQSTENPNEFTFPFYGSMVYWVTRGYAVLDNASFPIVGEGETEPNDSFIKQLIADGKAAIDAVDKLGYIDRERVAVGGHSYGAFMVANLLSHSNLFAAGIARSGAYNRTLTPFGFQAEERTYWEAPEVYNNMSPFMHADKMKTPLLLIHGEADNNSGTYPLQSERYFNALKGLGATCRLVILPKESHGYKAKESVLHLLWEQDQWLEKYVKGIDE